GGLDCVPASEEVFFQSSRIALDMVRRMPARSAERFAAAGTLMMTAVACVTTAPHEAAEFFGRYASFWKWADEGRAEASAEPRPEAVESARRLVQSVFAPAPRGAVPAAWR